MRLPRPRLTIRRLMILVAVVGLLVAIWTEGERRRQRFRDRVRDYAHSAIYLRLHAILDNRPPDPVRSAWFKAMQEKYEFAARYPWLPVSPDPPEPK